MRFARLAVCAAIVAVGWPNIAHCDGTDRTAPGFVNMLAGGTPGAAISMMPAPPPPAPPAPPPPAPNALQKLPGLIGRPIPLTPPASSPADAVSSSKHPVKPDIVPRSAAVPQSRPRPPAEAGNSMNREPARRPPVQTGYSMNRALARPVRAPKPVEHKDASLPVMGVGKPGSLEAVASKGAASNAMAQNKIPISPVQVVPPAPAADELPAPQGTSFFSRMIAVQNERAAIMQKLALLKARERLAIAEAKLAAAGVAPMSTDENAANKRQVVHVGSKIVGVVEIGGAAGRTRALIRYGDGHDRWVRMGSHIPGLGIVSGFDIREGVEVTAGRHTITIGYVSEDSP